MKLNCLTMSLVIGMLAGLPAYANQGINNATYAARFRSTPPAKVTRVSATKNNPRPWGPPRPYAVKSH